MRYDEIAVSSGVGELDEFEDKNEVRSELSSVLWRRGNGSGGGGGLGKDLENILPGFK